MARPLELALADVGPFLGRLLRLDRSALVRLRRLPLDGQLRAGDRPPSTAHLPTADRPPPDAASGRVALWGRVPWEVLVTRTVPATVPPGTPAEPAALDVTVSAGGLLTALPAGGWPARRDADWHWPLPPSAGPGTEVGSAIEEIPAADVLRLGAAAAATLRDASGRMGERVLRDALLDHVAIEVVSAGQRVEIRQRLIQALLRMGFVATDDVGSITVRTSGGWVGLAARHGAVWQQMGTSFAIRVLR